MKKHALIMGLVITAAFISGCSKEVLVKIRNRSSVTRKIQLTVPTGTRQIGAIGPGGSLTHMIKIKKDLLPASCHYSAGGSATNTFEVYDEMDKNIFFFINPEGRLIGPNTADDEYTDVEQTGETTRIIDRGTVID